MAIRARQVVELAQTTLQDETGTFWPETELLGYLNDGQREIVRLKPDANAVHGVVQLEEGSRQTLPEGAISLIDVPRNMGTDGQTPGAAIIEMPKKTLDIVLPNWHAATPSATVEYFCFDERDPKVFWNYPPQPAANRGYVEQLRADNPTDCALDVPLSLADEYANDLYNFILARAFGKETWAGSPARAAGYMQAFMQGLGIKESAEMKTEPSKGKMPQ